MAITEKQISTLITLSRLRNSEVDLQRVPLDVEKEVYDLIRQGRYQDIHLKPFVRINDNMGLMAKDPLTHYTYLVVALIAYLSRMTIETGVLPDDSFDLSDALLYALSDCKTLDDIHDVYQLSATMFAKLIYQHKEKKHSYQVERILNYVSRNIFKKITLEEVADYVGLSTHYLSNLFSKEMGITLHHYIQQEKVTVACNLLMHTDRPVSDIATYMGFQTPSNFATVFRKWKGMSPTKFRSLYYQEVF